MAHSSEPGEGNAPRARSGGGAPESPETLFRLFLNESFALARAWPRGLTNGPPAEYRSESLSRLSFARGHELAHVHGA